MAAGAATTLKPESGSPGSRPMPRIPQSEVERIKAEVDLAALIRSKGLELKRHGSRDLAARCPFHEDATASLIVTPAKNLWHCLGCGKGGSAIDFVMVHDGLSFRHAFEVLADGRLASLKPGGPVKHATARTLPSPIAFDADDHAATRQVIGYYHERLKQTPAALEYLHKRGITAEAVDAFRIGFADRTLGLRLPQAATRAGAEIRERLKRVGLLRAESGHEHFNGCAVFPILDGAGNVAEVYGRKINAHLRPGTAYHLYLPGPHVGIWNGEALRASREIVLCESVIDALTFWCAGFRNATCIYGTEGFTDELFAALLEHKTERVYLAYDRDPAGDRAAARDAERLLAKGVECLRIRFPGGMDANEYARKVTPPDKSLRVLIQSAEWLGKGSMPEVSPVVESASKPVAEPSSKVGEPPRASSSLAAELAAEPEPAAKKENYDAPLERRGDDLTLTLGERSYRVRGLDKNNSFEVLKVNLRLMAGGLYHVNVIDLYHARQRQGFIEEAARETLLDAELIKRDLGKVLLKLEELQEERIQSALAPATPAAPTMSDDERADALALLRDPQLLDRLLADFDACGVVGEDTNKLVGYLAAVSRKFAKPLGVIIQSTSAAGKTTLMEAVLAFVPEEERVKYSAMTGQALFYLGETDIRHKILAIAEEEGAEKATYALKLLQSEGELTIASTGKDEDGRLKTETYHVEGPAMIFFTTTSIELDEELANRCLTLSVDESREQTRRIHALQREEETIAGHLRAVRAADLCKLHQNAQRLLQPLPIHNPFAARLTFPDESTRLRRDQRKYLTLIRAIALLHQHQRPRRMVCEPHGQKGVEHIEVTLDDIATANRLAGEVLGRSLDEMPPQTRRFLDRLHDLVGKLCDERKCEQRLCLFTQRQAREFTGWSAFQVKKHIARLVELEYALPLRSGRGTQIAYELVYSGEGRDGARFLMGLIDADELRGSLLPLDYDGKWERQNGKWEPPGSPEVAPWERGGSTARNGSQPSNHAGLEPTSTQTGENAQPESFENAAS